MGPTIIFDKSAIQSVSARAVPEISRYFYTNVTPVLLHELLADLRLERTDLNGARAIVAGIAKKVIPIDAITNAPYQALALSDLLGMPVKMDRRPVVAGGQRVTTADGRAGVYIGVQPESEAVLRWRAGEFSQADLDFAVQWRDAIRNLDVEGMKNSTPKFPFRLKSLVEVQAYVDTLLSDPLVQESALGWLMDLLLLNSEYRELVRRRWRGGGFSSLARFSHYGHYCLRVNLLFLTGLAHNLLGTKNTNVIDMEYLYYAPFARVFCSGDKFLKQLAPLVLAPDQSFVGNVEFRQAVDEIAARREAAQLSGGSERAWEIEPAEGSLVRDLWVRHRGRFVPQGKPQKITPERSAEIMAEIRPFMDAVDKVSRERPPNKRWPS